MKQSRFQSVRRKTLALAMRPPPSAGPEHSFQADELAAILRLVDQVDEMVSNENRRQLSNFTFNDGRVELKEKPALLTLGFQACQEMPGKM